MRISLFVDMRCTPEAVFGWLEQPEKAKAWMTSVSSTEILTDTPARVGTTFRETVSDAGGSLDMNGVITGFVKNERIAFHLVSKVHTVDVEYRVTRTATGTRLETDANVRWKFPVNVVSLFAGAKMRHKMDAQLREEFARLKALCEANAKP